MRLLDRPLAWLKDNPGRQLLTGSFHPVDDAHWDTDAYNGIAGFNIQDVPATPPTLKCASSPAPKFKLVASSEDEDEPSRKKKAPMKKAAKMPVKKAAKMPMKKAAARPVEKWDKKKASPKKASTKKAPMKKAAKMPMKKAAAKPERTMEKDEWKKKKASSKKEASEEDEPSSPEPTRKVDKSEKKPAAKMPRSLFLGPAKSALQSKMPKKCAPKKCASISKAGTKGAKKCAPKKCASASKPVASIPWRKVVKDSAESDSEGDDEDKENFQLHNANAQAAQLMDYFRQAVSGAAFMPPTFPQPTIIPSTQLPMAATHAATDSGPQLLQKGLIGSALSREDD